MHPLLDNLMGIEGIKRGLTRYDISYASIGIEKTEVVPFRRKLKKKYSLNSIPYITVHDGFDPIMNHTGGRATKTWDMKSWKKLVSMIRAEFEVFKILQVGGPRSRAIPGVDRNFANSIDFIRSAQLIEDARLHIDGESGLVHAAHVMGTPSVVMFGPTPVEFFGYPDNYNIAPRTCGGCWWLTKTWMEKCPLNYETPECMDSIQPEEVMEVVRNALRGQ